MHEISKNQQKQMKSIVQCDEMMFCNKSFAFIA